MAQKHEGPLTLAATAFEAELARYEELTDEIGRIPITSEKGLTRAKKQLGEAAESQLRLAELLRGVVQALDGTRERQERCMQQVLDAAQSIQSRTEQFLGLMERFSGLGARAREVQEPVAAVVARKAQGAPTTEVLAGVREVLARTEAIVVDAEALSRDAASGDWNDIARAADALKQQVQSARNRLLLAEQSVAAQAPS